MRKIYECNLIKIAVTVRNLNVTDWYYGIYYNNTVNGTIYDSNASSNVLGFFLTSSSNYNTLSGNIDFFIDKRRVKT